jgi:kinesin family protein 3/17
LKFANRAKNIKNTPIINEDVDQRTLLRKYELEIRKLKNELDEKNKTLIDKGRLLQLEEDKRKAEQDRVAAMAALEARSKEFFVERDEKRKLEDKIHMMYSQMLVGGRKIEETPAFKNALEEQQRIIREQYEKRLNELEKERTMIEEDKLQVDRYKQLLLKQRDIMIALTSRLNERDETIIQLQEELDAYDRIHRETEEMLEIQMSRIKQLEGLLRDNNIPYPKDQGLINQMQAQQSVQGSMYPPSQKGGQDQSAVGCEVVTYDGQETFNITNNNLLSSQEKINQLSRIANDQKVQIIKLKHELAASKDQKQSRGGYEGGESSEERSENVQQYYENEIDALSEKVQIAEESARKMSETLSKLEVENKVLREENMKRSTASIGRPPIELKRISTIFAV